MSRQSEQPSFTYISPKAAKTNGLFNSKDEERLKTSQVGIHSNCYGSLKFKGKCWIGAV